MHKIAWYKFVDNYDKFEDYLGKYKGENWGLHSNFRLLANFNYRKSKWKK